MERFSFQEGSSSESEAHLPPPYSPGNIVTVIVRVPSKHPSPCKRPPPPPPPHFFDDPMVHVYVTHTDGFSVKVPTLPPMNSKHPWVLTRDTMVLIAWIAVVFGINSTSNADVIAQSEAECNLLLHKCY